MEEVKGGKKEVELSPQNAFIRRLQHLLAERHDMTSKSAGKEPGRHVKIVNN
ncbi:MAG: R3H domain-containing nucleic acid-binding protein [Dehalococcoidia bacterium]